MSNLKCHVYYCRYNDCSICRHQNPDINENAECCSFSEKTKESINNPCMFEYAEDKRFSFKDCYHDICCKTFKCSNNSNANCLLENVRIDCVDDKALCMNFRKNK